MRFANRIKHMGNGDLLSIMQLADAPDIISFSGGFPSPETYPVEDIKESFIKILENDGKAALSYSSTNGYILLRELIAERMKNNYKTLFGSEQIIITSGSQQALDMSGLLFIDKDDVILFETPSYLGALNAMKSYEAELVAIPTDEDGIQLEELKRALDTYGDRVKLIYVIPDFQNPTSRCWSIKRRKAFMEMMADYDVAIIEDAAYSELSFKSEKEKPIISFDTKGQVIYCGTFSKIFCPGLRIGWICTNEKIIQQYLHLKSSVDLSTSAITQHQIAYYLQHYDIEQHIREITSLYKKRRDVMLKVIENEFPKEVQYNEPMGGIFLWMTLPADKDSRELLRRAIMEKVAFVPGGAFYPMAQKNNEMRINFSNTSEEQIKVGMTRLGRITREYLKE